MPNVLVVATGRRTRGGITSVIKAHEQGSQWQEYHCRWIQTHRDGRFLKLLYFVTALAEFCLRLPFADLVHLHCSMRTSSLRKRIFFSLARSLGKKTIVHFHPAGEQYFRNPRDHRSLHHMLRHADRVLVLSPSWQRLLQRTFGLMENVRVLFNPCPEAAAVQRPRQKHVLFAGTLIKRKGYETLLRAFGSITAQFPDWHLIMAGNGELEQAQAIARELCIEQQVEFPGWIAGAQKEEAFSSASIFCLASEGEGFPMAVLDAWAYGVPVISTPVGGIPDVAQHGENILLFEPGDIVGLALALQKLMGDASLRERLSAASLRLAQQEFRLDSINEQLGRHYAEVAAS